jgi:uncharacterized protein YndB with AHSA1/START domain
MRQSSSVVVEREPDAVFAYLADPANLATWLQRVEEVRVPEDDAGEGQAFEQRVTDPDGQARWFEGRALEPASAEEVRFRVATPEGRVEVGFRVEPAQAGARVTETVDMPLDGWARKVLAPIVWVANRSRIREHLDRLRAALEQPDAGDPA